MSESSKVEMESLVEWVRESGNVDKNTEISVQALSGDAGFRQYFNILEDGQIHPDLLAVYAPPTKVDSKPFIDIGHYLREEGIHAPQIFNFDPERGFLLIENFGDNLYLSDLNGDTVESLYGEALLTLLRIQQSPAQPMLFSDYDEAKLREEMDLFPHWFVEKLLGHELTDDEKQLIEKVFKKLIISANEQPRVFVHRDYHSRNLIHRNIGPPGVIDYQDAVWGPITYDLVSLLKDCYIRWPTEFVERWALAYGSMISSSGLIKPVTGSQFLSWFDLMGMQRHLKVLGIFARLFLRDGKSNYLSDLPLVIRYTLEVCDKTPELEEFGAWFKQTLLPICEQQAWYKDYQQAGYSPMKETNS